MNETRIHLKIFFYRATLCIVRDTIVRCPSLCHTRVLYQKTAKFVIKLLPAW